MQEFEIARLKREIANGNTVIWEQERKLEQYEKMNRSLSLLLVIFGLISIGMFCVMVRLLV